MKLLKQFAARREAPRLLAPNSFNARNLGETSRLEGARFRSAKPLGLRTEHGDFALGANTV